MNNNLKLEGFINLKHRDRNGKLISEMDIKNLIVTTGKAEAAAVLGAVAGGVAFSYIAIGIGVTGEVAGNTALESEISTGGGSRATSTNTLVTTTTTNDTLQLEKTFTFSSSFAVTEAGIFNAASSGDMLARKTFAARNVANLDTLTITWKIVLS